MTISKMETVVKINNIYMVERIKSRKEVGESCLKNKEGKIYLDELDPKAGNPTDLVIGGCSSDMEEQIENILIKVDEGIVPVQQALRELLLLFSISKSVCNCRVCGKENVC